MALSLQLTAERANALILRPTTYTNFCTRPDALLLRALLTLFSARRFRLVVFGSSFSARRFRLAFFGSLFSSRSFRLALFCSLFSSLGPSCRWRVSARCIGAHGRSR